MIRNLFAPKGDLFEQRALEHLLGQGLRLLERNWHCRFGEIDLIMNDGDTLVFVEVRKRGSAQFGGAAASITATKLSKISASASLYLTKFQTTPPCRIDAVIFDSASASRLAEPTWMKNISQ